MEEGLITNISRNKEGKQCKGTLGWAQRRAKRPITVRKIAELGIGMKPHEKIRGATIIDEKTIGSVHIANGSNAWFGGDIRAILHLDHVIKDAMVKADGRVLRV